MRKVLVLDWSETQLTVWIANMHLAFFQSVRGSRCRLEALNWEVEDDGSFSADILRCFSLYRSFPKVLWVSSKPQICTIFSVTQLPPHSRSIPVDRKFSLGCLKDVQGSPRFRQGCLAGFPRFRVSETPWKSSLLVCEGRGRPGSLPCGTVALHPNIVFVASSLGKSQTEVCGLCCTMLVGGICKIPTVVWDGGIVAVSRALSNGLFICVICVHISKHARRQNS